MRDNRASETARRVAAHRLGFDRVPTDYGDPASDERLCRDVAADTSPQTASRMAAYIAVRTTFVDEIVVHSIEEGVGQVVAVGAGYDGRSLRYAHEGVTWFELDHPATQADKLERIGRLGIDASAVRFVAADFAVDDVSSLLAGAGFDAARPALFVCEGVAVYLEVGVLESLLARLRSLAAPGSTLAISMFITPSSRAAALRRKRFMEGVARLGEPLRSNLEPSAVAALLERTRWRMVHEKAGEDQARASRIGLVTAVPMAPRAVASS